VWWLVLLRPTLATSLTGIGVLAASSLATPPPERGEAPWLPRRGRTRTAVAMIVIVLAMLLVLAYAGTAWA
jgi:hypothetical protein